MALNLNDLIGPVGTKEGVDAATLEATEPPSSSASPSTSSSADTNIYGQPLFDDSGKALNPTAPVDNEGRALSSVTPPRQKTEPPEDIGGVYHHDPRAHDDPRFVGNYLTDVTFFGGLKDRKQELKQPGTGDLGYYAGGGGSVDPKTGKESRVPAVALPDAWKRIMPYGTMLYAYDPKNPDRRVKVVYADKGPAEWVQRKGIGADLYADDEIKKYLNVESGGQIGLDFTGVLKGTAQKVDQMPQPGTAYDEQLGNGIRQEIAASAQGANLLAGPITSDAFQAAIKRGPVSRNADGSAYYGNGISVYPDTGVVQVEAGGTTYKYNPGDDKPTIVNHNAPQIHPGVYNKLIDYGAPTTKPDGTPFTNDQEAITSLDSYLKEKGIPNKTQSQVIDQTNKILQSGRNIKLRPYYVSKPNYDALVELSKVPESKRTGIDDVTALENYGQIVHPGTVTTGHEIQEFLKSQGLSGDAAVIGEKIKEITARLAGDKTVTDVGTKRLSQTAMNALIAAGERDMRPRAKQALSAVEPQIQRLKTFGVSANMLSSGDDLNGLMDAAGYTQEQKEALLGSGAVPKEDAQAAATATPAAAPSATPQVNKAPWKNAAGHTFQPGDTGLNNGIKKIYLGLGPDGQPVWQ